MSLIDQQEFPGSAEEWVELMAAFGKDCTCKADGDGKFTHVCPSHERYAMDPTWGPHLVYARRLRDRLLREEFVELPPADPTATLDGVLGAVRLTGAAPMSDVFDAEGQT